MPKKVVRVEPSKPRQGGQPTWQATPEAKGKATTRRVLALLLWALAIGGEAFAIFRVLKQSTIDMTMLIAAIVVIGVLAILGDLLWKSANRLDPASESEGFRFFVQNQLGAILAIVAFLPLIFLIFTNKNMNQQQKTLAGGIGIVAFVIAALMGISINPPSVEQYSQTYPEEVAVVMSMTGKNLVFWTKDGTVYHLCQSVSDLQRESQDNTIYSGTVADAHNATPPKTRLTLEVQSEAKQCGFAAPALPSPAPTR